MTTKANFIARLSAATNLSRKEAAEVLETVGTILAADLGTDGVALVPGLGKLKVQSRGARQGRNPRTGESLTIPARKVVKFAASRSLKQFVASVA